MMNKLSTAERLKDLRVSVMDLNLEELAEKTGLSRSALGKYETDDCGDISSFALITLAKFYGVSTDYILGLTEEKTPVSYGTENQYFSQDVLAYLKSGKINCRLLSELIMHKDFRKLMTDLEIVVDRHVDQYIDIVKMMMSTTRKTIMEKHGADTEDVNMKTLELASQAQDIYLANVIHDDLDAIIRDIREDHLSDVNTADPEGIANQEKIKSVIELAASGAPKREVFMRVMKEFARIPQKKQTEEDADALMRIVSKSDLVREPKRKRGKMRLFRKKEQEPNGNA